MKRWAICLVAVVMLAGAPLSAPAQQPGKPFRIGMLSPAAGGRPSAAGAAFRNGLRDLGYIDGGNITIEVRLAAEDFSRLPAMAADLVRLPVDVIFTDVAQIARRATRTIPIVSATLFDPIGAGLAASLSRPGGNVTGLTLFSEELSAKRLQLLEEAISAPAHIDLAMDGVERLVTAAGLKFDGVKIESGKGLEPGLDVVGKAHPDAVLVAAATAFFPYRKTIVGFMEDNRLAAIYGFPEFAEAGGLISYSMNFDDLFRQAAGYVDKILRGASPGELPVQQATIFRLLVNLTAAKALGLTIPPAILARAEVIE